MWKIFFDAKHMQEDHTAQLIFLAQFLSIVWIAGRIFRMFGLSSIIPEIAVGIFFGSFKGDDNRVPFWNSPTKPLPTIPLPADSSKPDSLPSDSLSQDSLWMLLGLMGVALMVAESGTHIDIVILRKVGLKAAGVGLLGTILPLLSAWLVYRVFNSQDDLKTGFAVGACLAPTSVGMALKLLGEASQLNTEAGQMIVTAAFLDDIFSIVLLSIVEALNKASDDNSEMIRAICLTLIGSTILVVFGLFLATKVIPWLMKILTALVEENQAVSHQPRDEILLGSFFILLMILIPVASLWNAWPLGAFVAGLCFCEQPRLILVWRRQVKRIAAWLTRMFFVCVIGMAIKFDELKKSEFFWSGLCLALMAGILCKFLAGYWIKPHGMIVGVAMMGRGEFAFYVLKKLEVDDKVKTQVVWALCLTILVAPILFNLSLKHSFADKPRTGIKRFAIIAQGHHHLGVHYEIVEVLHALRLDILEANIETDGITDMSKFLVSTTEDLDADIMAQIKHDFRSAIQDQDAQIMIKPVEEELWSEESELDSRDEQEVQNFENWLEIKIMSAHDKNILVEIYEAIEALEMRVVRGHVEDYLNTELDVFFVKATNPELKVELDTQATRQALRKVFKQHNLPCEIMVKKIRSDQEPSKDRWHDKNPHLLREILRRKMGVRKSGQLCSAYEIHVDVVEEKAGTTHTSIHAALRDLEVDVQAETLEQKLDENTKEQHLIGTIIAHDQLLDAVNRREIIQEGLTEFLQKSGIKGKLDIAREYKFPPDISSDVHPELEKEEKVERTPVMSPAHRSVNLAPLIRDALKSVSFKEPEPETIHKSEPGTTTDDVSSH